MASGDADHLSHLVVGYKAQVLAMTLQIEPRHDLSPNEIDAIEDRIYDHNSTATGRDDGHGLGFVIRNEVEQMVGVVAGYTWSGNF